MGQNQEYIENGVSGVLIPPGDVDAFAHAVVTLLRDPDRRQRLGVSARQRIAEFFTWEHLATDVEQAYRIALQ